MTHTVSRRKLLAAAATVAPVLASPLTSLAAARDVRELGFVHAHTSEKLRLVYWEAGDYLADALQDINRLLRDFRTDDVYPIDPGVLDILHATRSRLGAHGRFEILSGYRSPKTNAMLANKSTGVAKRSLHMQGRALDVRLQGVAVADLRAAAVSLRAGGVGHYPASGFVHVDTGRVRTW
jgi:uncharacterized protein YcbK (DUF882 family)